jgi:hypothetical protein
MPVSRLGGRHGAAKSGEAGANERLLLPYVQTVAGNAGACGAALAEGPVLVPAAEFRATGAITLMHDCKHCRL